MVGSNASDWSIFCSWFTGLNSNSSKTENGVTETIEHLDKDLHKDREIFAQANFGLVGIKGSRVTKGRNPLPE